MNEQIKAIWNTAASSHEQAETSWQTKTNFLNRFAALIVAECQTAAQDLRGYSGVGEDGNPYDTASWNAALTAVEELINLRLGTKS